MGLSIWEPATTAWRAVIGRLLPQDCLLCGAASGDDLLCRDCASSLPLLPAARCPVCAQPLPTAEICGRCLGHPPHFDATVAAFVYAFPVDKLIQQLKFAHRLAIAGFFAAAMARGAQPGARANGDGGSDEQTACDLLVPVPLSPRRLRERGFNQAGEIARALARRGVAALDMTAGQRMLETPPQSLLPWKERQRNVRGAFACTADLTGKTVAVIDDVMTTGATINEFARVLKAQGAKRVIAWVAARAVGHHDAAKAP